jgi:hypothetical protein
MIDLNKYKITTGSLSPEVKSLIDRNKQFSERLKDKDEEYRKRQEEKRIQELKLKQEALQRYNGDKSSNGVFDKIDRIENTTNPVLTSKTNDRATQKYDSKRYAKSYAYQKQNFDYANALSNDVGTIYAFKRSMGKSDEEIKQELVPKANDYEVEQKLAEIENKLKQGNEGVLYNIQEGYLEKEVMDLLSKEAIKRMNGLPNKLDEVNKFIEEHPEMSLSEENDNALYKGMRFTGEFVSQTKNSMAYASKDLDSWATAAAIIVGGIAVGAVTGGTALPAYVGVTASALATLSPFAAMGFGMSYGAAKKMAEVEGGLAYNEYIQQGIHPDIAKDMAQTVGAINGVLEMVEMGTLITWLPGASVAKDLAMKKVNSEMTKKILKTAAAYGINLSSNMLQEAAQESTTMLGLTLSDYMQNAPNPNTLDGLKELKKTMTSDEYLRRVGDSAIGAAESMWLLPIGSGLIKTGTNQILEGKAKIKQSKGFYTAEDVETDAYVQEQKKLLLDDGGVIDTLSEAVIKESNATGLKYLTALEPMVEALLAREDLTNGEKQLLSKKYEQLKSAIETAKEKVVLDNPDIIFEPTSKSEIAGKVLNREVPFITLDKDIYIDYYKDAEEKGILDKVIDMTNKGKTYSEIADEVAKMLPRGKKNVVDASVYISAIEAVNREINAQKQYNLIENLDKMTQLINAKTIEEETIEPPTLEQNTQEEQTTTKEQPMQEEQTTTEELATETTLEEETQPTVEAQPEEEITAEEQKTLEKVTEPVETKDGKYSPSDIVKVPVEDIRIDQQRFQFRESGTTNKFSDTDWKDELSGVLLLWEDDKDGTLYVVNGHHRLLLAKENNVDYINARILKDVTDKEARAMGALINIAEDNATAVDVAKYINETGSTREELIKLGISPRSKILRDGEALSKLSKPLFRKVATGAMSIENAVIIGNELPNNEEAQAYIAKKINELEAKDKIITPSILESLIRIEQSSGFIEGEQINLLGEIDKKSYAYEKSTIVDYVKKQLKNKKKLLKNVSKETNAQILESLGNKVNIDENIKQMESTDLALYLLDKTAYYKSSISDMFNEYAKELAITDKPLAVKNKALNDFIAKIENGELLNEVFGNNEVVEELENQASLLEAQTELLGEKMVEVVEQPSVEVVINPKASQLLVEEMQPVLDAMSKNPIFNNLIVEFNGKEEKIVKLTKKELEKYGYDNAEAGEYRISGYLERPRRRRNGDNSNNNKSKLVLTNSANKGTLLHEVIHYVEQIIPEINPDLANLIDDWANDVYEQAKEQGIEVWDRKELLANALTLGEFGYASDDIAKANLVEVDPDIIADFKTIVSPEFIEAVKGKKKSKKNKQIKLKYKGYAERQLKESTKKEDIVEAKTDRLSEISNKLENSINGAAYYSADQIKSIMAIKTEEGMYDYIIFENGEDIADDTVTLDKLLDIIQKNELIYDKKEIHEELQQYDRTVVENIFNGIDVFDFGKVLDAAKSGNINASDYDLILSKYVDRNQANLLIDEIRKASKTGFNLPNDKVSMTQFLNRFFDDGTDDTIKIVLTENNKYAIAKLNFENQDTILDMKIFGEYDTLKKAIDAYLNTELKVDATKEEFYKAFKEDMIYLRSKDGEHSKYVISNRYKEDVVLNELDNYTLAYAYKYNNIHKNSKLSTLTEYTKEKTGGEPVYIDISKTIKYEDAIQKYPDDPLFTQHLLQDGYTAITTKDTIIPLAPMFVKPLHTTTLYTFSEVGQDKMIITKNGSLLLNGFNRTFLYKDKIYKYNVKVKDSYSLKDLNRVDTPIYIENVDKFDKDVAKAILEAEKTMHSTVYLDGKKYTNSKAQMPKYAGEIIDPDAVTISFTTTTDLMNKLIEFDGIPVPSIAIAKAPPKSADMGNNIVFLFKAETIDPAVNKGNTIYSTEMFTREFPVRTPNGVNDVIKEVKDYIISRTDHTVIARKMLNYYNFDETYDSVQFFTTVYSNDPIVKYVYAVDNGIYKYDKAILPADINSQSREAMAKALHKYVSEIDPRDVGQWLLDLVYKKDTRMYTNKATNFVDPTVQSYFADLKADNLARMFANAPKPDIMNGTIDLAMLKAFYAKKFESFAEALDHRDMLVARGGETNMLGYTQKAYELIDKIIKDNKENIENYISSEKQESTKDIHDQLKDPEKFIKENFLSLIGLYFQNKKTNKFDKFGYWYDDHAVPKQDPRRAFHIMGLKITEEHLNELETILNDVINETKTNQFDAVVDRVIPYSEIAAAIVPKNINPEVVKFLKSSGVKAIVPYGENSWNGLAEAVMKDNELLYQLKKNTSDKRRKDYDNKLVKDTTGEPLTYKGKTFDGEETEGNYYVISENPYIVKDEKAFNDLTYKDLSDGGYDAAILVDVDGNPIKVRPITQQQLILAEPMEAMDFNELPEYYHIKETRDYKERSWGKTVRDMNINDPWIVDILTDTQFWYDVKHNTDTFLLAGKILQEKGIDYVEAVLDSGIEVTPEIEAAGLILIEYYRQNGNKSEFLNAMERVAINATTAGQIIQVLSQFGKMSAEGKINYVKREVEKLTTPKDKRIVEEKTKEIKEKTVNILKETLDDKRLGDFLEENKEEMAKVADYVEQISMTPEEQIEAEKPTVTKKETDTIVDEAVKKVKQERATKGQSEGVQQTMNIPRDKDFLSKNKDKIVEIVRNHYTNPDNKSLKTKLKKIGLTDSEAAIVVRYTKEYIRSSSEQKLLSEINNTGVQDTWLSKLIFQNVLDGDFGQSLKALIAKKERVPYLSQDLIEHIYKMSDIIDNMPDGKDKDREIAKLIRDINEYLPVSNARKISTLHIMGMLLNIKSALRNILSNRGFRNVDTFAVQLFGTPIDKIISMKSKRRTVLFRPIASYNNQRKYYKTEMPNAVYEQRQGIDFSTIDDKFSSGLDIGDLSRTSIRRTFPRNSLLGKAETAMNVLMRAPDRASWAASYFDSLDMQMELKEKGYNKDITEEEMSEIANAIGLYRTFNDDTKLSIMFREMKRTLNVIGFGKREFGIGNIITTFPKTPANLIMRGLDYSPIGLVMTTFKLLHDTSDNVYLRQKLAVEGYARAIAGTGLTGIGVLLYNMGIITSGSPEDESKLRKFKQSMGLRNYSINISAILRHLQGQENAGDLRKGDKLFSYDWFLPLSFPLSIGADIASGESSAISVADNLLKSLQAGLNLYTDQPLFTGLERLFGSEDLGSGVTQTLKSVPSSFVPSIVSQLAQFTDGINTDPYTGYSIPEQTVNLIKNRLPVLRGTLPQRVSPLGDGLEYYTDDDTFYTKFLKAFLSPGIVTEYNPSDEAQFIMDLVESTGNEELIPPKPQKQYTLELDNGEKVIVKPTPEEWEEWQRRFGENIKKDIKYIMRNYSGRLTKEELSDEINRAISENKKEFKEYLLQQQNKKGSSNR